MMWKFKYIIDLVALLFALYCFYECEKYEGRKQYSKAIMRQLWGMYIMILLFMEYN